MLPKLASEAVSGLMSIGTSSYQPDRKLSNKVGFSPQPEKKCEPLTLVLAPTPPNVAHKLGELRSFWEHDP